MSKQPSILEVCVDSLASACAAQRGGANRIELCAALSEGGLTPSSGLVQVVIEQCRIPTMVMIRPRCGSFHYTSDELRIMAHDIQAAKNAGAAGVVFGVLTMDRAIDLNACRMLLDIARPMSTTFHRAFDLACDPAQSLEDLVALGFSRILTSGQAVTALEGMELLATFLAQADSRIGIMPGGGITPGNLKTLWQAVAAYEFHGSASRMVHDPRELDALANVTCGQASGRRETCEAVVRALRQILDADATSRLLG